MLSSKLPTSHSETEVNIASLPRDNVEQWAQSWTERFRLDAQQVDEEVHALCSKIRCLLDAIEKREA